MLLTVLLPPVIRESFRGDLRDVVLVSVEMLEPIACAFLGEVTFFVLPYILYDTFRLEVLWVRKFWLMLLPRLLQGNPV